MCTHNVVAVSQADATEAANFDHSPAGYGKSFIEEKEHLDDQHYFAFEPNNNNNNEYQCKCRGYWTGVLCDISYVNCGGGKDHRCYHGGTCVYRDDKNVTTTTTTTTTTNFVGCDCPVGYDGKSCQTVVATTAQVEDETPSSQRNGMSRGGKVSVSLFFLLLAVICWAMYHCQMTATKRLLEYAKRILTMSQSRITLPKVLQDTSISLLSLRPYHDNDNDDNSSCCSHSSEPSVPSLI